jgi:DNA-binding FadR family transcriptional regulator
MGAVLQSVPQRESLWDEHESIARAIGAGDADTAARLSEEHGAQASQTLAKRLAERLSAHTLTHAGDTA